MSRKQLVLHVILGLLVVPVLVSAQGATRKDTTQLPNRKTHFLRAGFQYGWILQTNDFVKGKNQTGQPIENYASVRLEFAWQTNGARFWQRLYNYPAYGLGIQVANYANEEELGTPSSLYGFFIWPVKRWPKPYWTVEAGFGLTDNWVAHDPKTNPFNVAIGAGRSVYIDVASNFYYPLAPHWDLVAGITGTHYSNGGTVQPNYGLNQVGAILYAQYQFQRDRPRVPKGPVPEFEKTWEVNAAFSFGVKNVAVDLSGSSADSIYENITFDVFNLSGAVGRQLSWMSKITGGADLTYTKAVEAELDASNPLPDVPELSFWQKLSLGVFAGYEQVVERGSLLVQIGYYLARYEFEGQTPDLYQRLGVKYHVFRNTFIGLNVKFFDFSRAENLEFTIGQRFLP